MVCWRGANTERFANYFNTPHTHTRRCFFTHLHLHHLRVRPQHESFCSTYTHDPERFIMLTKLFNSLRYSDAFTWGPVHYEDYEHYFMRAIFAFTICRNLPYSCETLTSQPEPNGIAQYFDITFFCAASTYDLERFIVFVAAFLFATKKFTFLSLLVMTVINIGIFTLKNSQGWIGHNNHILSLPLLVQTVHYAWCHIKRLFLPNPRQNSTEKRDEHELSDDDLAVFYTQQAVAATYVISAITKHVNSYNGWISDSPNLILQVLKTNEMGYHNFLIQSLDNNEMGIFNFSNDIIKLLIAQPRLSLLIFVPAYILEAVAFIFVFNRFLLFIGGILLISMHLGISLIMRLNFKYNEAMLLAYFVNVPYWVNFFYSRYNNKKRVDHIL